MSTKSLLVFAVALGFFSLLPKVQAADQEMATLTNAWAKIKDEGRRALVIGKIKAAYADRKDIAGRYIRVRFDGKLLQLAGFVPDMETAKKAEALAREIANIEKTETFWELDEDIRNRPPYNTHFTEQAHDALLKGKVLLSLAAPDVTSQLTNAEIIEVDVTNGKVTVYLIADAPLPSDFNLEPHIKPITGVSEVRTCLVCTY